MSFNEILPFSIHHLSFLQFLYIGTVWLLFLIFQKFKLSTIGPTFIDKRGRKASSDHSEKTCKDLNFSRRSFQDVQECKCSCSWTPTCYHSYYIYIRGDFWWIGDYIQLIINQTSTLRDHTINLAENSDLIFAFHQEK
jgi:hypothetical protein